MRLAGWLTEWVAFLPTGLLGGWSVCWMSDWMPGWLPGWLTCTPTEWLARGRLTEKLTDWPNVCLISWLAGVGRLTGRLDGCQNGWRADWLARWSILPNTPAANDPDGLPFRLLQLQRPCRCISPITPPFVGHTGYAILGSEFANCTP